VILQTQPFEILVLLLARAGQVVSRDELRQRLWPDGTFVDYDRGINTAIRKIRHALGDDAATPRFVETVVGKGYRFVASIESRSAASHVHDSTVEATNRPADGSPRPFPRYFITRGKQELMLEVGETLLGRDPAAGVCIDHPSVSRNHAVLTIGEKLLIEDVGSSRNGTFLNGRRVQGPVKIDHGAIIGLGSITLTFVVLAAPASTQSVSAAD